MAADLVSFDDCNKMSWSALFEVGKSQAGNSVVGRFLHMHQILSFFNPVKGSGATILIVNIDFLPGLPVSKRIHLRRRFEREKKESFVRISFMVYFPP